MSHQGPLHRSQCSPCSTRQEKDLGVLLLPKAGSGV